MNRRRIITLREFAAEIRWTWTAVGQSFDQLNQSHHRSYPA